MNKEILFTKVNPDISILDISKASLRLDSLFSDLATRRNNEHCGSGMGGNLNILTFFLNKNHELTPNAIKLAISNDTCVWGVDFLKEFSLKEIRKELMNHDEINSLEPFDELDSSKFDKSNSLVKKFINGSAICSELAHELDTENKMSDATRTKFVESFKNENSFIVLYCVRSQIGIERIVKHCLDEAPGFDAIFKRVNNCMDL